MIRILIADDDPFIRALLERILDKEFPVITCSSGEEALDACAKHNDIALAMYDVDMPGINGIDTAKKIWETYKIPFIIFSQFNDNNIIDEAIKIGALHYLVKPLDLDKILPAVKTALQRSKDISILSEEKHLATELSHTLNENRKLLSNIINEEESYRKELINDLHDEVGQRLTLIRMSLQSIQQANKSHVIDEKCSFALEQVTLLYSSIREIMLKLRPEILEALDTGSALYYLANEWQKANPTIKLNLTELDQLLHVHTPNDIIIYRALQEMLTNISKYSKAKNVTIRFLETAEGVLLEIKDDGIGFDVKSTPFGIGLSGIREKIISMGGKFQLNTAPANGVSICLNLPLGSNY